MVTSIGERFRDFEEEVVVSLAKAPGKENFLKNQILLRGVFIASAVVHPFANLLDTTIGLANSINAAASFGKNKETYDLAFKFLTNARYIIADPFLELLRVLNPDINMDAENNPDDGRLTIYTTQTLYKKIDAFTQSETFFKREIASRLTVVSLALCCVVARVFDFVIGVCAAFLAFLTLGTKPELYNFAYNHLQITGIIVDLTACILDLINPTSHKFLAS